MTKPMNRFHDRRRVLVAALFVLGLTASVQASDDAGDLRHSDIWLKATLVTTYTLNEHLNPLDIDVSIEQGVATLTGTVDSEVAQDLAGELAAGVEGIRQVNNELEAQPDETDTAGDEYGFRERVADANTTARVKSRLLWNAETQGLQINVDTRNGVVNLEGRVASGAEADLAAQIARNTSGVRDVNSRLEVDPDDENLQQRAKHSARSLGQDISNAWNTAKVKASLLCCTQKAWTARRSALRLVTAPGRQPERNAGEPGRNRAGGSNSARDRGGRGGAQ